MRNLLRRTWGLLTVLLAWSNVCAHDVEVDGIYYNLNPLNQTAEVTYKGNSYTQYPEEYRGHVIIPESILHNDVVYTVTSVGEDAFRNCGEGVVIGATRFNSITIPKTITKIGEDAFLGCYSLNKVYISNLSAWCGFASSFMPRIKYLYLNGEEIVDLVIPDDVEHIGSYAFYGLTGIKSIVVPKSVKSIGAYSFYGCTGLSNFKLPESVYYIGSSAFGGCTGLSDIVIPSSITNLAEDSFEGCTNLTTILLLSKECSFLRRLQNNLNTTVYYTELQILNEEIRKVWFGKQVSILSFENVKRYFCSLEFGLKIDDKVSLNSIFCDTIPISPKGNLYEIDNLNVATKYEIKINFLFNDLEHQVVGVLSTGVPEFAISLIEATQTTLKIKISAPSDKSVNPTGLKVYKEKDVNEEGILTLFNLIPDRSYSIRPTAWYNGREFSNNSEMYKTKNIVVNIIGKKTPTSLSIQGEHNIGDATLVEYGFVNYELNKSILSVSNLEPNLTYTFTYFVTTKEGGTLKKSIYIATPSLTLTTLKAKATSNTKAVICAETNICNEETGTGFEWRRIDAPDLVPSEEVYCAVHDGVMEGILNNLSPNTYYKYRPFYKSAKGNMYYGDWVGFGTADAYVYFTPTVHTYATATVEENSATLSGYALGGSDDVIEQGFEYWVDNATTRAGGDVMTVTTTGQRMSVTLDGLMYSTTYRYRAYVKTATETTYGEEQIFTTGENPNGIVEHVMTKDRTEIDAPIYNLQGIRMKGKDNLPRGLYIQGGKKFIVK